MTYAFSRQEKLIAEVIVQLGNIVEELRKIKLSGADSSVLTEEIAELNTRITTLTTNNSQLSAALDAAESLVAQLQGQLTNVDPSGPNGTPSSDGTPDSIDEVFNSLGITE